MTTIEGTVAPGFDPVAAAFEDLFRTGPQAGAAVSVYLGGRPVVDLWGGWPADTMTPVYSTTKAVPAACASLLVDRGLLDLDAPVAAYWPEFAAAGKEAIPVRWLLTHQAGLPAPDHRLPLADVLAWDPVVAALAASAPSWEPGTAHGYHALTYGWLVGEVIRRVTGRSVGRFFASEIAGPLGLSFHLGLPPSELPRVALPIIPPGQWEAIAAMDRSALLVRAMVVTDSPLELDDPAVLRAEVPSVNGVCDARSLARFYAALIGPVDGFRILSPGALAAATAEHAAGPDRVLGFPTRIGLGFGLPAPHDAWYSPRAFGFPGLGGSIGYADPVTGVAFGYVQNLLHDDQRAATALITALRGVLDTR